MDILRDLMSFYKSEKLFMGDLIGENGSLIEEKYKETAEEVYGKDCSEDAKRFSQRVLRCIKFARDDIGKNIDEDMEKLRKRASLSREHYFAAMQVLIENMADFGEDFVKTSVDMMVEGNYSRDEACRRAFSPEMYQTYVMAKTGQLMEALFSLFTKNFGYSKIEDKTFGKIYLGIAESEIKRMFPSAEIDLTKVPGT